MSNDRLNHQLNASHHDSHRFQYKFKNIRYRLSIYALVQFNKIAIITHKHNDDTMTNVKCWSDIVLMKDNP